MFRWKGYNNQERPNISHGKVRATCVAILGAHPNTIRLINEMLRMPVSRDYIRAKNRAAHNIKSHQLEQHFENTLVGGTFHDMVFNRCFNRSKMSLLLRISMKLLILEIMFKLFKCFMKNYLTWNHS